MSGGQDRSSSLETLRGIFKKPTQDPKSADPKALPNATAPEPSAAQIAAPEPEAPKAEPRLATSSADRGAPAAPQLSGPHRRQRRGIGVSVYLENSTIKEIDRIRRKLDVSFSAVVEEALQAYLRRQGS